MRFILLAFALLATASHARKLEVEDRQWGASLVLSLVEQEELLLEMLLDLLQVRLLEVTATLEELEELWLELLEVELLELLPAMPWKTLCLEAKAKARAREARVV